MEEFDLSDLARDNLSNQARDAMLDLILAWAHLDGALSMWIGTKFGVPYDKLSILLPRQDGASKLLKLRKLYSLESKPGMVTLTREFKKDYEANVKTRNTVAHSKCLGSLKSDPSRVVFQTFEAAGQGKLAVDVVPLHQMNLSIVWAHGLASKIDDIMGQMQSAAKAC